RLGSRLSLLRGDHLPRRRRRRHRHLQRGLEPDAVQERPQDLLDVGDLGVQLRRLRVDQPALDGQLPPAGRKLRLEELPVELDGHRSPPFQAEGFGPTYPMSSRLTPMPPNPPLPRGASFIPRRRWTGERGARSLLRASSSPPSPPSISLESR